VGNGIIIEDYEEKMARCGITTMKSFKNAIKDIPDDCFVLTNEVGNIQILKQAENGELKSVGYIEMFNIKFFDTSDCIDCEFTEIGESS
jgi:hypothetical protein